MADAHETDLGVSLGRINTGHTHPRPKRLDNSVPGDGKCLVYIPTSSKRSTLNLLRVRPTPTSPTNSQEAPRQATVHCQKASGDGCHALEPTRQDDIGQGLNADAIAECEE